MIREAKHSDYKEMDAVFRASAKQLCVRDYDTDKIAIWAGKSWPERFIRSANDGCKHYVKILEEKIICFGSLNYDKDLLEALFVDPAYAGQGVGVEMLNFLFEQAQKVGIKELHVDSSLNAVNFYARHDFVEQSKADFTTQSGVVLDSVKMVCKLGL